MPEFKSLSKRLLVWQIVLSVGALTALCSVVYFFLSATLDRKQNSVLQQNLAVVEHLVNESNKLQSTSELVHKLDDLLFANGDLSLNLRNSTGDLLYEKEREHDPDALLKKGKSYVLTSSWGVVDINVVLDIKSDRELKEQFAWLLLAVAFIGSAIVAVLGFWISRTGLKPLRLLTQQTQSISAADLRARLDGSRQPHEIQGLVTQFNALLKRLQVSYEQMEDFNANVAHELTNPVATLITSHELALRSGVLQESQTEYLASNLEELQRVSAIVNDMLFMSRAESGSQARTHQIANLAVVAQAVADYYEASAEEAEVKLLVSGDLSASADVGLLKRALSNLVSNAIRHADKYSTVYIKIEALPSASAWARVSVENTGTPIKTNDLPKLFDRFFRADAARDNSKSHHGLGLAIVNAVAKMHRGKTFAFCNKRIVTIGFEFPTSQLIKAYSKKPSRLSRDGFYIYPPNI